MRYNIFFIIWLFCFPAYAEEQVVALKDTATLLLGNGKQVKLAGILTPERFSYYSYESEVRNMLERTVIGKQVTLRYGNNEQDRYNRELAQVFIGSIWLQGELLKNGLAVVYATADNSIMLDEMRKAEQEARDKGVGIWKERGMVPLDASQIENAGSQYNNQFRLIEGTIKEVAETPTRIYLNFGKDWKIDFTIMMEDSNIAEIKKVHGKLADLKDKKVVVRGWMENYNGPLIRLLHSSQLIVIPEVKE